MRTREFCNQCDSRVFRGCIKRGGDWRTNFRGWRSKNPGIKKFWVSHVPRRITCFSRFFFLFFFGYFQSANAAGTIFTLTYFLAFFYLFHSFSHSAMWFIFLDFFLLTFLNHAISVGGILDPLNQMCHVTHIQDFFFCECRHV